ncbi:MAG: hypothetical protein U1F00_18750 [Rhodoferax sp.]
MSPNRSAQQAPAQSQALPGIGDGQPEFAGFRELRVAHEACIGHLLRALRPGVFDDQRDMCCWSTCVRYCATVSSSSRRPVWKRW